MRDQFQSLKVFATSFCILMTLVVGAQSKGLDFEAELEKQNALNDVLTESVLEDKEQPVSEEAKKVQVRLISASEPVSQEYVQAH